MNELIRFALVAFYPRVDDVPGLAELGVEAKIEKLRRDASPLFWFGVVAASLFFQIAPVLTLRRPYLAVWLDEEELDQHAHRLSTYPVYLIRQLAVLLKLVAGMFWAESKEIRALVNLPPYPEDPGTRRTEAVIARHQELPRAPAPALITLGRREAERGRDDRERQDAEGKVV